MNRLIIESRTPCYTTLCEFHTPYDYPFNQVQYACVDVDDEELCMLMLTHSITPCHPSTVDGLNKHLPYLPTYVVANPNRMSW